MNESIGASLSCHTRLVGLVLLSIHIHADTVYGVLCFWVHPSSVIVWIRIRVQWMPRACDTAAAAVDNVARYIKGHWRRKTWTTRSSDKSCNVSRNGHRNHPLRLHETQNIEQSSIKKICQNVCCAYDAAAALIVPFRDVLSALVPILKGLSPRGRGG
jgi:hypothetical protein